MNLIKFSPDGDRIVVEPSGAKKVTDKGIHIPENALERPLRGKVMAVGPDTKYKPGDIIMYGKYAGTEILIEDKEYVIMRTGDVFGKIEF